MSTLKSRFELSEVEVARSAVDASLAIVERLSRQASELESQRATAVRLAKSNGASLRDIAKAAGVSPQTVANLCKE